MVKLNFSYLSWVCVCVFASNSWNFFFNRTKFIVYLVNSAYLRQITWPAHNEVGWGSEHLSVLLQATRTLLLWQLKAKCQFWWLARGKEFSLISLLEQQFIGKLMKCSRIPYWNQLIPMNGSGSYPSFSSIMGRHFYSQVKVPSFSISPHALRAFCKRHVGSKAYCFWKIGILFGKGN